MTKWLWLKNKLYWSWQSHTCCRPSSVDLLPGGAASRSGFGLPCVSWSCRPWAGYGCSRSRRTNWCLRWRLELVDLKIADLKFNYGFHGLNGFDGWFAFRIWQLRCGLYGLQDFRFQIRFACPPFKGAGGFRRLSDWLPLCVNFYLRLITNNWKSIIYPTANGSKRIHPNTNV